MARSVQIDQNIKQNFLNVLTCSVCLESVDTFSEANKLLQCDKNGHPVCRRCVSFLPDPRCPVCRQHCHYISSVTVNCLTELVKQMPDTVEVTNITASTSTASNSEGAAPRRHSCLIASCRAAFSLPAAALVHLATDHAPRYLFPEQYSHMSLFVYAFQLQISDREFFWRLRAMGAIGDSYVTGYFDGYRWRLAMLSSASESLVEEYGADFSICLKDTERELCRQRVAFKSFEQLPLEPRLDEDYSVLKPPNNFHYRRALNQNNLLYKVFVFRRRVTRRNGRNTL